MVYLPTFTIFLSQMLVNIPHMDPMGYRYDILNPWIRWLKKVHVSWVKSIEIT